MALAANLHVSPEQLAESWEAHSLNKNVAELNDLSFEGYRAALRKDFDANTSSMKVEPGTAGAVISRPGLGKRQNNDAGSAMVTPPPSKRHNLGGGGAGASAVDAVAAKTPAAAAGSPSTKAAASITPAPPTAVKPLRAAKYGERTNVGQTVATFNPSNLAEYAASAADDMEDGPNPRCTIDATLDGAADNVTKPYRYMFTPLEERAKALDDHLVGLGEEIMERFDIKAETGKKDASNKADDAKEGDADKAIAPLEAVGVPRQEAVCCIGRICNEVRGSLIIVGFCIHSACEQVHRKAQYFTLNLNSHPTPLFAS
jgi:hypothetical protein